MGSDKVEKLEKPWLKSYPTGMPAEIDMKAFSSVRDILEKSCQRFADKPAYSNLGVTLTYRELDRMSRDFAAFLQSMPGLGKGERVAIMMPNLLQYPIAPQYTPRRVGSSSAMICIARTLGAPVIDPPGNAARTRSAGSLVGTRSPTTVETRWCTVA